MLPFLTKSPKTAGHETALSLVELMISVGLLGFVTLGTVKFLKYQSSLEAKLNAQTLSDRTGNQIFNRLQRDFEGRYRTNLTDVGYEFDPVAANPVLKLNFPATVHQASASVSYTYETKCRAITSANNKFYSKLKTINSFQFNPKQIMKTDATDDGGRSGDCLTRRACPAGQLPYLLRTEISAIGTRTTEFPSLGEINNLSQFPILGQCLKVTRLGVVNALHFQLDSMVYIGEIGENCAGLGGLAQCYQIMTHERTLSLQNSAGILILPKQ